MYIVPNSGTDAIFTLIDTPGTIRNSGKDAYGFIQIAKAYQKNAGSSETIMVTVDCKIHSFLTVKTLAPCITCDTWPTLVRGCFCLLMSY